MLILETCFSVVCSYLSQRLSTFLTPDGSPEFGILTMAALKGPKGITEGT